MSQRLFTFIAGNSGAWNVTRIKTIAGESLPSVTKMDVIAGAATSTAPADGWTLRGITSNDRYVTQDEKALLASKQQNVGRPEAVCAALIPIRKNAAWWALSQTERRRILEDQSKHIAIGMDYLPAIARRLHHCRDLSENEPFDFLTWFEYSPTYAADFNQLVTRLRATEEWKYVDREIDIRLVREPI